MTSNGGFLVTQIKQVQGRVFERLLQQQGLVEFNGPQGRILYVLWQEDRLPIVELSRRTGLAKTTLTAMLDRMETLGLLLRTRDEGDRRQQRVALTDKSRALSAAYERVSAQMTRLFYRGFSEAEIRAFEQKLQRILNNLEAVESGRELRKEE